MKQKTIFHVTSNAEEAIVIADDKNEAMSLLGFSSWHWKFEAIGTATERMPSDVLSRVSAAPPRETPVPSQVLRGLLMLQMVNDPSVLRTDVDHAVRRFIEEESVRHGYADWIDAYHRLAPLEAV